MDRQRTFGAAKNKEKYRRVVNMLAAERKSCIAKCRLEKQNCEIKEVPS